MAALSIENMANVENLTYTGVDADQFVGTGNAGNNVITGGDLADTLSGLGGNDTLHGGLGADTMTGGDGNDVYVVDEAGDVVTETNADSLVGGIDRVESDIDFTLGANVENLDLNGSRAAPAMRSTTSSTATMRPTSCSAAEVRTTWSMTATTCDGGWRQIGEPAVRRRRQRHPERR